MEVSLAVGVFMEVSLAVGVYGSVASVYLEL